MTWQALQTLSNREQRVADELDRLHVERYLPQFHEQRRWCDRWKQVDLPVFPGYLFARFEEHCPDARMKVATISGVLHIVGEVSAEEIESIRQMLRAGARPIEARLAYASCEPGSMVRVVRGPLTGVTGYFSRSKAGGSRLVVQLEAVPGAVAIEVSAADVEVVQKAA